MKYAQYDLPEERPEDQARIYKAKKALALAETIIAGAEFISGQIQQLPKSKHRRNIFLKSYHRRPMAKKRTARIMANIAIGSAITATQAEIITSQPIPRFKKGTPII